jgi:hypothetical protein
MTRLPGLAGLDNKDFGARVWENFERVRQSSPAPVKVALPNAAATAAARSGSL